MYEAEDARSMDDVITGTRTGKSSVCLDFQRNGSRNTRPHFLVRN